MYEQDYVMRLIKDIIRMLLKLFFYIDTENITAEVLEDQEAQDMLNELFDMVDQGNINEAENRLLMITKENDMSKLELALLFYSYLNEKDDSFLKDHEFSREEVKMGIRNLTKHYGLSDMVDLL